MSRKLEEDEHIGDELVALLQRLLAELPPNVASLEVRRICGGGMVVALKPTILLLLPVRLFLTVFENRSNYFLIVSRQQVEPCRALMFNERVAGNPSRDGLSCRGTG